MHFGITGRTDPEMRHGKGSTGRGTRIWVREFGARHCNQWGLYGVRVRQRRDAALFPNYFGQTGYYCCRLTMMRYCSIAVLATSSVSVLRIIVHSVMPLMAREGMAKGKRYRRS